MTRDGGERRRKQAGAMNTTPSIPPAADRVELHALTSLRFFAALHVVLFHTHSLLGDSQPVWLIQLASGGHHAVPLFFVLSGFILHHTYHSTDWSTPGAHRHYLVHRLARIYPVYVLSFLVDAPRGLGYFFSAYDPGSALVKASVSGAAFLSMTQTWVPRLASAWNAPGWSVSTEAFFYLLCPLLLTRIHRLTLAQSLVGLALMPLAASLGRVLPRLAIDAAGLPANIWMPFAEVFPPLRLFEFAFGLLLGRLFTATESSRSATPLVLAGFFLTAIASVLFLSSGYAVPWFGHPHGLLLPFHGLLIICLAVCTGPLMRVLSCPPLRFLGGASYAIYLLHLPVFAYFLRLADRAHWTASPAAFVTYLVLIIGSASLVFRFYEEPMRRLIRRRFASTPDARARPPVPPAPPPGTSRFPRE